MSRLKNEYIAVRLSEEDKQSFIDKASQYGDKSDVHRELIKAFNEDRLIIKSAGRGRFDKLYEDFQQ